MNNYEIKYPTQLSEIDIKNDNIDVIVSTDTSDYSFVFITPQNLTELMKKENDDSVDPNFRFVVVGELKEEVIESVVNKIMQDQELVEWYSK